MQAGLQELEEHLLVDMVVLLQGLLPVLVLPDLLDIPRVKQIMKLMSMKMPLKKEEMLHHLEAKLKAEMSEQQQRSTTLLLTIQEQRFKVHLQEMPLELSQVEEPEQEPQLEDIQEVLVLTQVLQRL